MAEVGANPELASEYEPVKLRDISLGEHAVRLGHLYKKPGATYELRHTYSKSADILGGDRLSQVYFRTENNIYMLDDEGNLLNAGLTARSGKAQGIKFERENLEDVKMVVGEPFLGGMTTNITEIVPVTEKMYPADQHKGDKSSTILEEFQKKVPPRELGAWERDHRTGEKFIKTSLPDNLQNLRKPQE